MFEIEFRVACGRGDDIHPYLKKYPRFINCVGPFGWTPLFYAVRANQIEVVKVLLENGADLFVCDKDGITILDLAMKKEYGELHTLLKIETMNVPYHKMEFSLACGRGDLKTMWSMLEKDTSIVHKPGLAGWTPLFYAVRSNQIQAVKLLLIFGADTSIKDTMRQTVLDIAKRKEYDEIVKLIETKFNSLS